MLQILQDITIIIEHILQDDDEIPTGNKALPRSRAATTEESEQALKRLKTS